MRGIPLTKVGAAALILTLSAQAARATTPIIQDVGHLGGGETSSSAINDAGYVTGDSTLSGGARHAYRYTSGGTMEDLGILAGSDSSQGSAVNNSGVVVGTTRLGGSTREGFRYSGAGPMQGLGSLGGGGTSPATAINDSGVITGWSYNSSFRQRAFRYTGAGPMEDLGTLPGGDSSAISSAEGINDTGAMVGNASDASNVGKPVLWRADKSIVNLDAWLDGTDPALGARWSLAYAFSINSAGLVTGTGAYDADNNGSLESSRAYVLDASSLIPEPTAAAMLLPMLAMGSARLRRKR